MELTTVTTAVTQVHAVQDPVTSSKAQINAVAGPGAGRSISPSLEQVLADLDENMVDVETDSDYKMDDTYILKMINK